MTRGKAKRLRTLIETMSVQLDDEAALAAI